MTRLHSDEGFDWLEVVNGAAEAKIALQGAHLFHYARSGEAPLLWVSPESFYQPGKAIRGGVPVCWPWFGKPDDATLPQHGFARTAPWEIIETLEPEETVTIVTLRMKDTTQPLFPYRFELTLRATIGEALCIELMTRNLDARPFVITEALHTYFAIDDVTQLQITGLENVVFVDFMDARRRSVSPSPIRIDREVDRVYVDSEQTCVIHDGTRQVTVEKYGSRSTVVWNPWTHKASRMADFADAGYRTMVCIETANALHNAVTLQPGERHTLRQKVL